VSAIISTIGDLFSAAIGWVGDIAALITGTTTVGEVTTLNHPILLLFCVLPLIGLGVGLFKRLINTH